MDKTKIFKSRIRNKLILISILLFAQSLYAQKQDFSKLTLRGLTEWENLIIETSLSTKADQEYKNSFVTHFKIKTVEKTNVWYRDTVRERTQKSYLLEYDTNGLLNAEHSIEGGYSSYYYYNSLNLLRSNFSLQCAIIDNTGDTLIILGDEYQYPYTFYKVPYYKDKLIKKDFYIVRCQKFQEIFGIPFRFDKEPYKTFYYFYNESDLLIRIEEYSENSLQKVSLFNYTYY